MFPSSSSSEREEAGEAAETAVGWGADKAAGGAGASTSTGESTSTNDADANQAKGLIFFPCSGGPHHSS